MKAIPRMLAAALCALLISCGRAPLEVRTAASASSQGESQEEDFAGRARAQVLANSEIKPNRKRARNVILFVGDGMGITTITAARILEGQLEKSPYGGEENQLSFEKLPYLAHSKTYQANQQVPDSAPTMTAIITGGKTNDGMLSVHPRVQRKDDFAAAADPANHLKTLLEQAEDRGMWTGVVSTARITHATPGACYAHTSHRETESDANLASLSAQAFSTSPGLKDIAAQLVDFRRRDTRMNGKTSPGLEVALGGGRSKFLLETADDPEYPGKAGERRDRDLTAVWTARGGRYVFDKAGFDSVDPATTGPVLGLFEPSHMQYEIERNKAAEPSLTEMTEKAIRILQRGPKGFFLMVEGGRIDHGHHDGVAVKALTETIELSNAVARALELVGDDTLVVVTADHSHAFTMSGYPVRGNPILGLVVANDARTGLPDPGPKKAGDGKPYTTLGYANGPGAVQGERPDLTAVDTAAPTHLQQALVPLPSETHGGEDVAIFARGPHAHLFQGTMEENAIYWVMARALGFW